MTVQRVIVVKAENKYDEFCDGIGTIVVHTTGWQEVSDKEYEALETFAFENPEYKLITDETERISDMMHQGCKIQEAQKLKEEKAQLRKAKKKRKAQADGSIPKA